MSQKVVTIKNDEHPKELCKKIGQNFYLINRDVFEIGDKWVREPLTFLDNFDGKRKIKNEHEYHTVYKDENLKEAVQTTKIIHYYNERVGGNTDICASVLKSGRLIPAWFVENAYIDKSYNRLFRVKRPSNKYYGMNEHPNTEQLIKSKKETSNDFDSVKKELSGLTFGFELESSDGEILESVVNQYKFVRLYDGSITGHEFVSVPLASDNFDYVKQFCFLLQKACTKNMFCSTHVHIGGIEFSAENFTSIFSLFKRLEHEIHALVPPYKKQISYFAQKRNSGLGDMKDHCKYLPDHISLVEAARNPTLFTKQVAQYFAGGGSLRINTEALGTDHYKNLFDTRKWNLNRYFFVNFVNYLFKKNGTIEFRLLESTFCFENILFWTLMNVAVMKYAIKEKKRVFDRKEKITLEDCVHRIYNNEVAEKVVGWMHSRRLKYSEYLNSLDDYSSNHYFDNKTDVSSIKW
jgi:hypothetical protein